MDFCDVKLYRIFVQSSVAHERLSSTWEINVVRMELFLFVLFFIYFYACCSKFPMPVSVLPLI